MFLLVPAHPGFPGQIPQSRQTVVCVCVSAVVLKPLKMPRYGVILGGMLIWSIKVKQHNLWIGIISVASWHPQDAFLCEF